MSDIKTGDRDRARKLFAKLASTNPQERATAHEKLEALLKRLGKNWSELPGLVYDPAAAAPPPDPRTAAPAPDVGAGIYPPDLVHQILEDYVALSSPHHYVAATLWAIHTHIHERFIVTPRLVLTSPVPFCGKTVLLDVLSTLVAKPEKADSITAAGIYYAIDFDHCTLLLDEFDNLELSAKGLLRSTLNSGHRKGGSRMHVVKNQRRHFSTFAPIALAGIGSLYPALTSRSIIIHMTRADGSVPLKLFDRSDMTVFDIAYRHIVGWVRSAVLNSRPEMPVGLRGRPADNWRPLLAIADACSPEWGVRAREAAVYFARAYPEEPIAITLLRDIRTIFNTRRPVDRILSEDLVAALVAMDDQPWSEWTGRDGTGSPRKLSQAQLASTLKPFGIRPTSIRIPGKADGTKKGYHREMFEKAWAGYCQEPEQRNANNVTPLLGRMKEKRK